MKKYLFCLTLLIINFCLKSSAQCTSQGPYPGSIFTINASIGNVSWLNTNGAAAADNNYATATGAPGNITNYLTVTGFSFSIPTTATICGIEVILSNSASGTQQVITDNSIKLIKSGVISGNDYATSMPWSTSNTFKSYGGSNDTWGNSWTAGDINSSDFGIAISANLNGISPTAQVDFVSVKVYYNNIITPLPVELINFSANENFSGIQLKWQTASELNNDYFMVERSENGINFTEMEKVTGAGNSQSILSYNYTDRNIVKGKKYFYRLKQVDFNGAFNYSDIISYNLGNNISANTSFTISNNNIIISNPENTNLKVNIYDTQGQLLLQTNSTVLPIKDLPKGVLLLEITKNPVTKIFKFLNL